MNIQLPFSQRRPKLRFVSLIATVSVGFSIGPVAADQNCQWSSVAAPARQVISCGSALKIEREAETSITIFERAIDGPPRVIEIENGAILLEVTPGSAPTQIRTPHAIAAVRGTTYVVDAGATRTAIFVLEGQVDVRKVDAGSAVILNAGEGIDVAAESPLERKTWPADRASALLARFGR